MKTRILFVLMVLMSIVLIAPAQKMSSTMGKKMPPAHAMTKGKKLGLKRTMPMRDPKTGRFMKKTLPLRDPKTGRFISTHKKTMGKKPSIKKG